MRVDPFEGERQVGDSGFVQQRHEIYHVTVVNVSPPWPWCHWAGRQPAWSTRARLELFDQAGGVVIKAIAGRWTSKPEPKSRTGPGGFALFDWALWVFGQHCDVHEHSPEMLVVAIKVDGDADCYLLNNDSYRDSPWNLKNPDFRILPGKYRLRVTLLYQKKPVVGEYIFENRGRSLDDVRIAPVAIGGGGPDLIDPCG